ncbi:MAG: PorP/SprF family type IX secretion system membrane protein, partial [Bacteroidia bacterium]|nr:PorP/SprF family type IX secretion system membrane protein [Bacteroidia bacterium]
MANGFGNLKKKPKMVIGGMVTTERIGLLQRTSFYGTYTYILKINKKAKINFGLGIGGIQHKVRVYDARPFDKDDNFMGSDVLNAFAFDANAGFHFYTKNFFLGFSDQQMPNSKILWDNTNGRNTNHFYAYTGYNFAFDAKREWIIQPSILARTNSPAPYQLEYMAKLLYREMIWLGFGYRHKSTASFLLGCKINNEFVFGYSFDFTLNRLQNYSTGTHELMLAYLMPFKKKKSKSELIKDADEEELNKIDNSVKTNLRNKKKKEKEEKKEEESKTETSPAEQNNQAQPEGTNTETTSPSSPESAVPSSTETTDPVSSEASTPNKTEIVSPEASAPSAETAAPASPDASDSPTVQEPLNTQQNNPATETFEPITQPENNTAPLNENKPATEPVNQNTPEPKNR